MKGPGGVTKMPPAVRSPLLSLLLLSVVGCSAPSSEDVEALDEAIVGGRVQNDTHPAVGYLAGAYDRAPFCTATLVEPTIVVTAAHCVQYVRASSLVFGTGKFDRRLRRTRVTQCVSNPRYRDTDWTSQYDFAWCELASEPAGIEPMGFATSAPFDARYIALGYGQTDGDDEDSAGPRKQLSVKRVDPEDEPLLEGLERMIATTTPRGDTCFGDSGSPLLLLRPDGTALVAGVLHGGVGDGDSDCTAGNISLYAPIWANRAFYDGY